MWWPTLLHASLLVCLARQTLQRGLKAQGMSWRRIMPARGVGIGTKGVNGPHGALGGRYVNKPLKAGIGHYPVHSSLGVGGYQPLGRGLAPGRVPAYGNHGLYGGNHGAGLPMGLAPSNGLGLGHGGKHAYGIGPVPGFAPYAGMGYPAVRPGYVGGAGNYHGGNLAPGAYGPGQGGYLGAAGKLGVPAAPGQGGYTKGPAGVSTGYANGAGRYAGTLAGNGLGYGNGYANPYGDALGTGSYAGQPQVPYGGLDAGLEPAAGKYGGAPPAAASQGAYGGAPVAPSRHEGDGGYPYAAQPIGLSGDGSRSAGKHGSTFGAPQAGYIPQQLGPSQDALGAKAAKYGAGTGPLGGGYKG
ncbi:spidroin-2 isoform X2 [Syngnathus typhle]|uniref:spidroin-2 isoform X2 n=1 Tax=Syngnathus typhle TaxID=161592 RepID=UPI002A69F31A|nr:spidroin-2 isoform X2 [Syngnathus typhle]